MRILVTGGCGFIGSALVLHLVRDLGHAVATLDALTYAANPVSLAALADDPNHRLIEADICDAEAVQAAFAAFRPEAVMHLAAESHVDRSITGPGAFIRTNVVGTQVMLEAARRHYEGLSGRRQGRLPLPARLHRRGLRLAAARGLLHRGEPLRPALALLGVESGLRPSGPGLG
jgi:dTDP-glucose 4,6-dehydratase